MRDILARFKSPVVIGQIVGTIVGVAIFFMPGQTEAIQVVSAAIVALVNIVSGLNNPADPESF